MGALTKARLCVASALVGLCPAPALAALPAEQQAALESRLAALEEQVIALRQELAAARAGDAGVKAVAQAAAATAQDARERATRLEAQPQPDGFRDGASTIRLGGYVKLAAASSRFSDGEVATNSLGRDFYLPQAIPAGGGSASRVQDFTAKQTRLWLNMATTVVGHVVKGNVEVDFQTSPGTQGSQRTTNGYNLALRRAWMQIDDLTIGQDWTTLLNPAVLPQSTDFIGATEGAVFGRQPLIRYSAPLGERTVLHVALENPESGTALVGAPALVENGDDRLPDLVTRLAYADGRAQLSLAGLGRQLRVEIGALGDSRLGWAISASGKIALGKAKRSDIRFMATYGSGAGRYVGLNFAPDALVDPATGALLAVDEFGGFVALRLAVAPQVAVNLIGSYQSVGYDEAVAPASLAAFNKRAYSLAGNLFYTPVAPVDLGLEYRHGVRELVGGALGTLDRIEFAAKYGF